MGEIKSTIDLVLEKTRGLSLNSEEKQKLAQEELERKLQGLISRYLDQLISLSRLTEEMEKMADTEKDLAIRLFKKHLLANVDLDRDNSSVLSALKEGTGLDIASFISLQEEYQSEKEKAKGTIMEKGLVKLKERGIAGSAVVPNLKKDSDWTQFLDGLRKRYQERLEALAVYIS